MATQIRKPADPLDALWAKIEQAAIYDDGAAAEHLAAGYPIYYAEGDTPSGVVI